MWLCESGEIAFTAIPKEISAQREENSALRLQLAELSDLPNTQLVWEALSARLESGREVSYWSGR